MITIRLRGTITADRQLIVDLPDEVPEGEVNITLIVSEVNAQGRLPHEIDDIADRPIIVNEALEQMRTRLAAAGLLSTSIKAPSWFVPTEEDELPIELPRGSPTMEQMIDEDRGPR